MLLVLAEIFKNKSQSCAPCVPTVNPLTLLITPAFMVAKCVTMLHEFIKSGLQSGLKNGSI